MIYKDTHGNNLTVSQFTEVPEVAGTKVVTSLASYDSVQSLSRDAGLSDVNKGNMINPVAYSECCKCRPSIIGL